MCPRLPASQHDITPSLPFPGQAGRKTKLQKEEKVELGNTGGNNGGKINEYKEKRFEGLMDGWMGEVSMRKILRLG